MVQRNPVNKLGVQAETKNSIKSEKKPSSQHQDVRNRGNDHLIKKMKKARSFKLSNSESKGRKENSRFSKLSVEISTAVTPQRKSSRGGVSDGSSPNYMKPTSCSDARKEGFQVTPKSQNHDKSRSPEGLSSSKSSASGQKPVKLLRRNSSLKPIRPSMKKSSGIALYPKLNSGRATCSSTLKDSKFPAYVELKPGGTELEGTSVMKICPYTYCSLNGHRHEPLPPLKRFLSAKRRFLRAQKSMKLRGISAPKMEDYSEGKEIDTGQMEFNGDMNVDADSVGSVIHLFEDGGTDFFIEIYAKPKEEDRESRPNSETSKVSDDSEEVMFIGDDELACGFSECSGTEEGGDLKEKDDQSSEKISEPDFDHHDISAYLIENYKCEEQIQGLNVGEEEAESLCDCECSLDGEFPPEESDSEICNMDWEEKSIHCSDDDGFDSSAPYRDEFVLKINPFLVDEDYETTNVAALLENDADEELVLPESSIGDSESNNDANLDDGQLCVEIEVNEAFDGDEASVEMTAEEQEKIVDKKNEEHEPGNVVLSEHHSLVVEESTRTDHIVSESPVDTEEDDDNDDSLNSDSRWDQGLSIGSESPVANKEDDDGSLKGNSQWDQDLSVEDESTAQDAIDVEEYPLADEDLSGLHSIQLVLDYTCFPVPVEASATEEANGPDHAHLESEAYESGVGNVAEKPDSEEDKAGLEECVILSNSSTQEEVQDGEESEDHHSPKDSIGENETMEIEASTGGTEEDDIKPAELDVDELSDEPLQLTSSNKKQLYKRRNRRSTEFPGQVKDFNPRPPRFLSLEPDPEAEKVDLRHQMMDERKNSEEWMVDHALRQILNKLAPARKRRVALLVEAFETVAPIPKYETPLRDSAASFPHIRPIQACR
ncbi:calmodulin binding protein PICBP-like [Aristolochia californica]|uniref:calmodulin binding protein PICBP-like n=1 Tax=Aristolochia californica TaxID=171875 RepID=UPI0035DC44E3